MRSTNWFALSRHLSFTILINLAIPMACSTRTIMRETSLLNSFCSSVSTFPFLFLTGSLPSGKYKIRSAGIKMAGLRDVKSCSPVAFVRVIVKRDYLLANKPSFPFRIVCSVARFQLFSFLFHS